MKIYLRNRKEPIDREFSSEQEIKEWVENFYQRNFEEEKEQYDIVKNKNLKYSALYPEMTLENWFNRFGIKIMK